VSTNPQLFFAQENFFLNQLFYRFNKLLTALKSIKLQDLFKKGLSFTIFVLFCNGTLMVAQQDAQFSQNMFNMLSYNPAVAGLSNMINLQAISRQQYTGFDGNPKTTVFGADAAVSPRGIDGGIGVQFLSDQIGFITEVGANVSGSIKFDTDPGILSVGLMVGVRNHVLNPKWYYATGGEGNDFHKETDNGLPMTEMTGNAMDMGLGAFFSGKDYYAGMSLMHLHKPQPQFDGNYFYFYQRTMYVMGGKKLALVDRPIELMPSFFVKTDGVSFQTDLNCNVFYKKRYWGGLTYRLQDAVVLLAGLEMKSGLKVGYSFDIPLSPVARMGNGGHEVSLGYTFEMSIDKKKKQYKSVRYL
jgi:type IX secretion system PorP/SprF family membrane protein